MRRLLCWFGFHSWQRLANFPFHQFNHWVCRCGVRGYQRKGGGRFVIVYGDQPQQVVNANPVPALTRDEIRKLRIIAEKQSRLMERQRRTINFTDALDNYWKNAAADPIRDSK